ncbi:MAG: hypothetical protein EAZ53_13210 [Bacteroidetes bacterium]|nr:MAG: hypothetical protein EAZ53_13210 [Bacteroidota bacterium]
MKKIITQFGNISVYNSKVDVLKKTILFLHGNSCKSQTLAHLNIKSFSIYSVKNEKIVNNDYISKLNIPTLFDKKIHMIENTSHFPQLENVKDFNALLLQFANYCFSF